MRENGDSLGEALERYPDQFLPQVVAMVKLGEEAGSLSLCLESVAKILEVELDYRSQVLKAFIQPVVMLISGLFVLGFAYISIVPLMQTLEL
jgi:type II secretory pathway component PulF